jgi:hypothetical protein
MRCWPGWTSPSFLHWHCNTTHQSESMYLLLAVCSFPYFVSFILCICCWRCAGGRFQVALALAVCVCGLASPVFLFYTAIYDFRLKTLVACSAVGYVTIVIRIVPRNHRNTSQNPSILLKARVVTWPVQYTGSLVTIAIHGCKPRNWQHWLRAFNIDIAHF